MITSIHNPRIQNIRALVKYREERESQNAFTAEGVRLCEESWQQGWRPDLILTSPQLSERGKKLVEQMQIAGVEREEVTSELMERIAATETPQGILVVLPIRTLPLPKEADLFLVCDGIRDPGNLGTILRTALAANVQGVLLPPGAADAFSPKVLRAGMGAHFRLPIVSLGWDEIRAACKENCPQPTQILVAEMEDARPYWETDLRKPTTLVVGSEAEGASTEMRQMADANICIPMPGKLESLNAAVAAGILLFEIVRQRNA